MFEHRDILDSVKLFLDYVTYLLRQLYNASVT